MNDRSHQQVACIVRFQNLKDKEILRSPERENFDMKRSTNQRAGSFSSVALGGGNSGAEHPVLKNNFQPC
jgi:hypothetical protein